MHYGYAGKVLRVDLSSRGTWEEDLDEDLIREYIGGWGINVRLYHDLQRPDEGPFSPSAPIIFGVGSLVGTPTPGANEVIATYKTPIFDENKRHFIDCACASTGGGIFGSEGLGVSLKKAGYDHLIITGKSNEPVYLNIIDDEISLINASKLWGVKDTYQTSDWLIEKHGGKCGLATIGRAGEKQVRYAMAIVDYTSHLGRFGLGAVMGSKNLKGIIVRGSNKIKISNMRKFMEIVKSWQKSLVSMEWKHEAYRSRGVNADVLFKKSSSLEGDMGFSEVSEKFGFDKYLELVSHEDGNRSDSFCPIKCKAPPYKIKRGKYKGTETHTGFWFLPYRIGQRLGLNDHNEACKILDICNRKGVCVFTMTQIINWITRLREFDKGLKEEFIKMSLERNVKTYIDLIEKTADRDGIGDILAEGWYPIGSKLERDPKDHVWGTGIIQGVDPIQDARITTLHPQSFTHFTGTRPHHGGHQSIYTRPDKPIEFMMKDAKKMGLTEDELEEVFKCDRSYGLFNIGKYAKHVEDHMAVMNSVGECAIHAFLSNSLDNDYPYANIEQLASVYTAVTGREVNARDLKIKGERAFNLYRILQIREGIHEFPELPRQWFNSRCTIDGVKQEMRDYYGIKSISKDEVLELRNDYCLERGWTNKGVPTDELLERLDLSHYYP